MLSPATLDFAWQHRTDDPVRLLLGKAPEGVDMAAAAQQIEGWQTARHKWPSLADNPRFLFPPRLNREQASSEATAAYKASLLSHVRVADLTGGMGIDTIALSKVAASVDYYEIDRDLCTLLSANAGTLGISNIVVHCGDSLSDLSDQSDQSDSSDVSDPPYDFALIDPARRDSVGRRVAAFEDCTPDILAAMPRLRSLCRRLLVKASPMVDIAMALTQLPPVSELHVVALRGECKELLFVIDMEGAGCAAKDGARTEQGRSGYGETTVHCVNLQGPYEPFVYRISEAASASAAIADLSVTPRYLSEPDATIMKAGCHALAASRFGLAMLSHNSHIYCSMQQVEGFPGRCFEVVAEAAATRKALAPLLPQWKANIVSRNHPLSADALRRRLRLADGGEMYLVATSVGNQAPLHPTAFVCRRLY